MLFSSKLVQRLAQVPFFWSPPNINFFLVSSATTTRCVRSHFSSNTPLNFTFGWSVIERILHLSCFCDPHDAYQI